MTCSEEILNNKMRHVTRNNNPLGCCRAFEARPSSSLCVMKLASTGDLRRSLTLRRNATDSITTRSPCLCPIPSHIIDDVTAAIRVGAVPSVLQWQYRCLVHCPFTILKYLSTYGCSPNEFLGPTSLGNEDESNGLYCSPNDAVYITHAVLTLSDDALAIHNPCSWTDRKVKKAIRMVGAGKYASPAVRFGSQ
jgi:hypothetical protein